MGARMASMGHVRQFLWVVAGIMLAGACGPEDISLPEPIEQTTPESIVPVLRDGRYKLSTAYETGAMRNYYLYSELPILFPNRLTSSEVTSAAVLDYVEYWAIETTNTAGTEARIYFAAGSHYSYESTTGSGFGNLAFFNRLQFDDSIAASAAPHAWLGISDAVSDKQFEVLDTGTACVFDCGTPVFGQMEYWGDGTGFTVTYGQQTAIYVRDDSLPSREEAEIVCTTADHRCSIQKHEVEEGNSTPQKPSAQVRPPATAPSCVSVPSSPARRSIPG